MPNLVYVETLHSEPPSTAITGVHLRVKYGEKGARLYIPLPRTLTAHQPLNEAIAAELRELAGELLRMADQPSAILGHNPAHN